jgi:hypothetical protein
VPQDRDGERPRVFLLYGTTHIPFFNPYRATLATCYGPVDAHLHVPIRVAFLDSVEEVTKVLTLTAIDWSGKP